MTATFMATVLEIEKGVNLTPTMGKICVIRRDFRHLCGRAKIVLDCDEDVDFLWWWGPSVVGRDCRLHWARNHHSA